MAISVLSSGKAGSAAGNTISVSIDTATGGPATAVAIWVSDYAAVGIGVLTENQGNTLLTDIPTKTGATVRGKWYYCFPTTTNATHTFTYTITGGFPAIIAVALKGSGLQVDRQRGVTTENAGNPGSFQAGSVVPRSNNEIVLAGVASNYDYTSVGGGFSLQQNQAAGSGTNFSAFVASLIQTTATSANPTWVMAVNGSGGTYASGSNLTFIEAGGSVDSSTYSINLDGLEIASIPLDASPVTGAFTTTDSGTNLRLRQTGTSTASEMVFAGGSKANDWTMVFRTTFANTANPVTSLMSAACQHQLNGDEYQVWLSRGTGESRGALGITKLVRPSTTTDLGSPTYVGTSGTTFAQNEAYDVTVVASGTGTRAFAVTVQRVSDSKWLKSDGSWNVGVFTALSVSDSSSPLNGVGNVAVNFNASALDAYLDGLTITSRFDLFTRNGRTTPVITKGTTYGGIQADALAAPAVCYDGSRYVMTVSIWNTANAKWYTIYFQSPDMVTWTYIANSLRTPSGANYIFGNAGIMFWNGKYVESYSEYQSDGTGLSVKIEYSTDLLSGGTPSWTLVKNPLASGGFDSSLAINPGSGNLECWYGTQGATRVLHMQDTSDSTLATWTDRGDFFTTADWTSKQNEFGAPCIWYPAGGVRHCTFDVSPATSGHRYCGHMYSPNNDTTWLSGGIVLGPSIQAWENAQAFDNGVIVTTLADGFGSVPHMLYAGSDGFSAVDGTNSSIGLTVFEIPNTFVAAEYPRGGHRPFPFSPGSPSLQRF